MTNEETREVLGDVRAYLASRASLENEMLAGHTFTDICNAIKALERQTSEDCVSRDAVLNLFNKSDEYRWETAWIRRKIEKLPSVTPTSDAEDKYDIGYNCGYADAMSDIAESEG